MKKDGLLAEILNAVVNHERKKVKTGKQNIYLNQKKQLWYGLMNQVDEETGNGQQGTGEKSDER